MIMMMMCGVGLWQTTLVFNWGQHVGLPENVDPVAALLCRCAGTTRG